MSKLNPQNERIKRDFLRYQKKALGKSEGTLDAMRTRWHALNATPAAATSEPSVVSRRSALRSALQKRTASVVARY
jgi:hypothetical protein